MRRVLAAVFLTVAGVVMLLQYRTPPLPPVKRAIATATAHVVAAAPPRPKSTPKPTPSATPKATPAPARTVATPVPTRRRVATPPPKPRRTPAPTPVVSRTYTGAPAAACNYGDVVVRITVRGTRISDAQAPTYPTDRRQSQQINQDAIPQLDQETVKAQSSNIDTVSGATCTSDGYRTSLQSAIDQWKA